jgi:hypothetical protein
MVFFAQPKGDLQLLKDAPWYLVRQRLVSFAYHNGPSGIWEKLSAVGHELAFLASSDAPDHEDLPPFSSTSKRIGSIPTLLSAISAIPHNPSGSGLV